MSYKLFVLGPVRVLSAYKTIVQSLLMQLLWKEICTHFIKRSFSCIKTLANNKKVEYSSENFRLNIKVEWGTIRLLDGFL